MTIPHYDEVREARATLRDNEGAEQLLLDLERAQTLLGLQRKAPSDELPGEAEIARLVQWPGLEAIRSADAPEDAPWTARVRARELALQGAAQLLRPAAHAAHEASHRIRDLREAQLNLIAEEPAYAELHTRVQDLYATYGQARQNVAPLERRRGALAPLTVLLDTYGGQIRRALASEKNRDALVEAFTNAAHQGLAVLTNEIGLDQSFDGLDATSTLTAMAELDRRVQELDEELAKEAKALRQQMADADAALQELLG